MQANLLPMVTLLIVIVLCAALIALANVLLFDGKVSISESIEVGVKPAAAFAAVADQRAAARWNPWLQLDPECSPQFAADGASMSWDSPKIGAGRLSNDKLAEPDGIAQRLEFVRPHRSAGAARWQFAPTAAGTKITWEFSSRMPFLWRVLAGSTERMLAGDFRYGLVLLRQQLEPAGPQMKLQFVGVNVFAQTTFAIHPFAGSFADMRAEMKKTYPKLIAAAGPRPDGADYACAAVYHKVNPKTSQVTMELAAPTDKSSVEGYAVKSYPAGLYCRLALTGRYEFLDVAWMQAFQHLRINKLKFDWRRPALDIYHKGPHDTDNPDAYETSLNLPVKQ